MPRRYPRYTLLCALVVLLLSGCASAAPTTVHDNITSVAASIETEPMPHEGDAADDPAIWVDRDDPARSTIIGTDKLGGLAVYDLAGKQIQYLPDGNMNNVDLRADFALGDQSVVLVTAGNRSGNRIAIYRIDPATRRLEDVAARAITTLEVYGSCMYHSATTGKLYYFVNSKVLKESGQHIASQCGKRG